MLFYGTTATFISFTRTKNVRAHALPSHAPPKKIYRDILSSLFHRNLLMIPRQEFPEPQTLSPSQKVRICFQKFPSKFFLNNELFYKLFSLFPPPSPPFSNWKQNFNVNKPIYFSNSFYFCLREFLQARII